MKILKIVTRFIIFGSLNVSFQANSTTESCAVGWTTDPAQFESAIQYDDMQGKINPSMHVLINGKAAKVILDTGSNVNILWDASLLDETPAPDVQLIESHVASAGSRAVPVALADEHGNVLRRTFYVTPNSALAADGYSGIVSPQAIAQDSAMVLDFEKNCFFSSARFDIRSNHELDVRRGSTIPNSDGILAIPVGLDGREIPVIVDTGASVSAVLSSLVATKPKGKKSAREMDVFGVEIPRDEHMRLVDLSINDKTFKLHPVIPRPTMNMSGMVVSGYIGMDVLKDHVIYHDAALQEFVLLTRQESGLPNADEHDSHSE